MILVGGERGGEGERKKEPIARFIGAAVTYTFLQNDNSIILIIIYT